VIELAGERVEGSFVLVQGAATAAQIAAMATTDGMAHPRGHLPGFPELLLLRHLQTCGPGLRALIRSRLPRNTVGEVDTSLNSVNKLSLVLLHYCTV
jgi:hypothetical protein